jgi:hypothetical protein
MLLTMVSYVLGGVFYFILYRSRGSRVKEWTEGWAYYLFLYFMSPVQNYTSKIKKIMMGLRSPEIYFSFILFL